MFKVTLLSCLVLTLASCRPDVICYNHVKITKETKGVVWFKMKQENQNPRVIYLDSGKLVVDFKDLTNAQHTIIAKEVFIGVSCEQTK